MKFTSNTLRRHLHTVALMYGFFTDVEDKGELRVQLDKE